MKEIIPVTIRNNAFNFCKFTMAFLLWMGLLFQSVYLVILTFGILILSVLFRVQKAPLVRLYTVTIEKRWTSEDIIVDQNAVLFAHLVGAVFAGVALLFMAVGLPLVGWILTGVLAILKTSGAFGKCGAMKLYSCLNNPNGTCCRFGKKIKGHC